MIENISWVFFDIGSTIINEQSAYEHRFREIAEAANSYTFSQLYFQKLSIFWFIYSLGDIPSTFLNTRLK